VDERPKADTLDDALHDDGATFRIHVTPRDSH
jgi:hypothetical protein